MEREALVLLGSRVRAIRLTREISQEELADKCGLHRTYIGGVERGERNIGFINLLAVAEALEVPPSALLVDFE
jgi:transcriptional regulator with XRE-family HTH domain